MALPRERREPLKKKCRLRLLFWKMPCIRSRHGQTRPCRWHNLLLVSLSSWYDSRKKPRSKGVTSVKGGKHLHHKCTSMLHKFLRVGTKVFPYSGESLGIQWPLTLVPLSLSPKYSPLFISFGRFGSIKQLHEKLESLRLTIAICNPLQLTWSLHRWLGICVSSDYKIQQLQTLKRDCNGRSSILFSSTALLPSLIVLLVFPFHALEDTAWSRVTLRYQCCV